MTDRELIRSILVEYYLWEERFLRGYRGTMARERFEAHLDRVAEQCGIDEDAVYEEAARLADEIMPGTKNAVPF